MISQERRCLFLRCVGADSAAAEVTGRQSVGGAVKNKGHVSRERELDGVVVVGGET